MKPKPTLQVKRQPASGFRVMRAVTSRSKSRKSRGLRAATTLEPEDLGEVPGVGVARALIVILLLHVAAIAGIWIHNQWTSGEREQLAKKSEAQKTPLQPSLIPGVEHYLVQDGDNYFKIAEKKGVSVAELKRLNSDIDVTPGIKINIPGRRPRVEQNLPQIPVAEISPVLPPIVPVEHPPIQLDDTRFVNPSRPGALEEEARAPQESDDAVLIRPRHRRAATPTAMPTYEQPRAREVRQAPVPAGRVHTIRKGDTIWSLSKKYGVNQNELMRLNGITDPGKIKLGASLRIPGQ